MKSLPINILDANREIIETIHTYESLLWTKQYQDVGGCVLVIAPTDKLINLLKTEAKYISRFDDDMICEIKKIALSMDNLTKKHTLTITGIGAATLLNQRIVWSQTNYTTEAEIFVRRLVLDSIVEPTDPDRKIDFIKFGKIKGYPEKLTKQVTYDEVLPTIIDVCKTYDLGFKLVFDDNNDLIFEVYRGLDCTDSQDVNDLVIFSKDFNNLQSFDWEIDFSAFKNVCLVGGEGEGTARKTKVVGSAKGIDRYETFADAKNTSSEEGAITNYDDVLTESGNEDLAAKTVKETFACKIDVEQYEYKTDYDLGYKVTVVGDYGLKIDAKIIEIVECNDASGYRITANLEL